MKKYTLISFVSGLILFCNCNYLTNSELTPNITVFKNESYDELILFTEMDIKNNGTRIYGIDPTDKTLKKHIHISNLTSVGADITESGDIVFTSRTDDKLYILDEKCEIKQKVNTVEAPLEPVVIKNKIFVGSTDYNGLNLKIYDANSFKILKNCYHMGRFYRMDISRFNDEVIISNDHFISSDVHSKIVKMNINTLDTTGIIQQRNKYFVDESFSGFAVQDSMLYAAGIFNEFIAKFNYYNGRQILLRDLKEIPKIRNLVVANTSYFTMRFPIIYKDYLYMKIDLAPWETDYMAKFDKTNLSQVKLYRIEDIVEFSEPKNHIYYNNMFVIKYETQVRFINIETGKCVGKIELPVKKGTEPDYPPYN